MSASGFKHGGWKTSEYNAWRDIKGRCFNPKHKSYPDYGGRGITVCPRWKHSFENFIADMGMKPSPSHSIDRMDNALGYSPENCRWGTKLEQVQNRRYTRRIQFGSENLTIAEWSKKTGLEYKTILVRLNAGWSASDIITKPSRNRNTI